MVRQREVMQFRRRGDKQIDRTGASMCAPPCQALLYLPCSGERPVIGGHPADPVVAMSWRRTNCYDPYDPYDAVYRWLVASAAGSRRQDREGGEQCAHTRLGTLADHG